MTQSIEALRQQAIAAAQGSAMLNLAYIGVVNGLFSALHGGPGSAKELASRTSRDLGYVERWCDAAFAFELLDQRSPGVFALTDLGDSFRPEAAGTLMPFAVHSVLGAHMAERAAGLMPSGERPGESVLGERDTVLPWFGPMLEAMFAGFFEQHILPELDVFAEIDARSGLAVDLGCGNGWYLRRLAKKFRNLRGIGLDGFDENIDAATAHAQREGLGGRLEFRSGDLHRFSCDEPVDLIAMNRALHHVWNDKDDVFDILRDHLGAGGVAVIWEPAWPADRSELRAPALRPMAFQNLSEHVQGNHFLRPDEIAEALSGAGLEPTIHRFAGGKEAVIIGRKR